LRTVALDRAGLMVELVDVGSGRARSPISNFQCPARGAMRRHNRATLCGGHVCLVSDRQNGEINFRRRRAGVHSLTAAGHLTDAVEKYRVWEEALRNKSWLTGFFRSRSSRGRTGGCLFVILEIGGKPRLLAIAILLHQATGAGKSRFKNQLHYLLRCNE